ncbi:oxidoreductase [Actinocatenispora rupis]|uniref:Oxidoreductase n=1 Tax=Actinocatenispora rupis TaxID=519421 RepID=A0A8J3J3A3_9ACTN|nr:oxidoreductase [Actinocatenispora rupis]GID11177.1 oxidoreductase [Actinocatenispora rupis]
MTNEFRLGDLTVRRMGFGAMRTPMADRETALAVLRTAVESGVDHIDTADFYRWNGQAANELIGAALRPYRKGLVIATKVGPIPGRPNGFPREGTIDDLVPSVERNLRELGRDHLDLVYLRVGGIDGPPDESVADRFAVLAGLRERGLVRHLGLSNVHAGHLAEARAIAPVVAVQNEFHVADRSDDAVLAACAAAGIAYVPYFPLGGGRTSIGSAAVSAVAARHGATAAQVALAWLLARSPVVLAIPGTSSPAHLAENLAAADLVLTGADLARLAG